MIVEMTKEYCWDELMDKYPLGMKNFCSWIDKYKKQVNWDQVFAFDGAPKYHELPGAMQLGIFIEYVDTLVDQGLIPVFRLRLHKSEKPEPLDWKITAHNVIAFLDNNIKMHEKGYIQK